MTQRYGKLDYFTDNAPLRRGKGSAYEGGVRVPAIIHWPGVIKPGTVCNEPIMSIDFYPTILSMTRSNGNLTHNHHVDGRDLTPLLRDPTATLDRDLYWHYPHYHAGGDGPYTAIRSGNYRLIEFHEDQKLELYDLSNDLGEENNLISDRPDEARRLHQKLIQWREQIGAQMPNNESGLRPRKAKKSKTQKALTRSKQHPSVSERRMSCPDHAIARLRFALRDGFNHDVNSSFPLESPNSFTGAPM